jgi:8-oxo-dGTP pyrophosphatase MutT (NUDIX family)
VRELEEEANVRITIDDLQPFAHWVTPEIEIRRYDTRFFLARMPDGQVAKHDDSETTASNG